MRPIGELILAKRRSSHGLKKKKNHFDEKSLEKIFFEAAQSVVNGVEKTDFKKIAYKDKKFYVKTAYSGVANELWRNKEKIRKKINEMLDGNEVEKIDIK